MINKLFGCIIIIGQTKTTAQFQKEFCGRPQKRRVCQIMIYEEEYEVEGTWTFEVDEKDDDIEDVVESALAPAVSNDSEKQGIDLLIEVLQTAPSWQEVSVALKDYEEFKQQAWEGLTPVERRRIISITPIEVRKLSQAKRNGKIIDFCEIRQDVYKVQYSEYIFGEIIYKDKLNDFLARL